MSKKVYKKWQVAVGIIALLTVVNVFTWAVTGVVAYPTQQHKDIASKMVALTNQAWTSSSNTTTSVFDSPEFKELEGSNENRYSSIANTVLYILSLVVWVGLVWLGYVYLRTRRIFQKPAFMLALLFATSSALSSIVNVYAVNMFYPEGTGALLGLGAAAQLVLVVPLNFVIALLLSYLVARIVQWRYNKKFGFFEE